MFQARIAPWAPGIVFGALSIMAGLLTLRLPETRGRPFPQTIAEVESWPLSGIQNIEKQRMKLSANGGDKTEKEKCVTAL